MPLRQYRLLCFFAKTLKLIIIVNNSVKYILISQMEYY